MAIDRANRIFADSSASKRLAVRAMRAYVRFSASDASPLTPSDSPDVRILIQSMGGIGNTIMATPLIAETRRLFPNAQIDLLTSPEAAELLAHDANLTGVLQDPFPGGTRSLFSRIRATRYDAAMVALNAHLSLFAMRIVFGRIPRRLMHGYPFRPYDDFSPAYTHVLQRAPDRHDVLCNVDLLNTLTGVESNAGALQLTIPDDAIERAQQKLSEAGWQEGVTSVALCQGSSEWMAFKRWPLDRAMEFAESVNKRPGIQIVVFCGPDERSARDHWRARMGNELIVVDPMPLTEFAAAVQQMEAVVANDSLPMHIAAALKVPVVALFGPTDSALTGPWAGPSRVIAANVDYAPYYELPYPVDPKQFPDCMAEIVPDTVMQALDELLRERNAAPS